jgi:RNA polymerase sigma-70 factor (ECF subfamily)
MADILRDIEAQIPRLRRYARALCRDVAAADDLVQDCLTRALAKLHLWQDGTDLRAWLFTILHNQHVDRVRRQIRAGTMVDLAETELPGLPPDQEKRLELRDFGRALRQLPEAQRAVILLVGLEGMRYEAVGARLGIPVGTVRSRLSRGRDALRRLTGAGTEQPAEAVATGTAGRSQAIIHRSPPLPGGASLGAAGRRSQSF